MSATRRFPASVRAALTDDDRDVRAMEAARRVSWINRREYRSPTRVSATKSCVYLSPGAVRLLPADCRRVRIGLLNGRVILQPTADADGYVLSGSGRNIRTRKLGSAITVARLREHGVPVPSRWKPRWNAELGWLECEREE